MVRGQKHLVKCRCILPQFRSKSNPPVHCFVVFSTINDDVIVPKFAQCNNCGIVHKVFDLCRSEIVVGKEYMSSIITIDDIRPSLDKSLVACLESNFADLPTWEHAKFVVDNKAWGTPIVLTTDKEAGVKQGKYVLILGESLFKVESFVVDEVVK